MPNETAMKLASSHCILQLPLISGHKGNCEECNEKTQVKYYTNNITPKTSEVLWEKWVWPPGTAVCWGKQMSQEMVTSDSLKKAQNILPKFPEQSCSLGSSQQKSDKIQNLHLIELKHNTVHIRFMEVFKKKILRICCERLFEKRKKRKKKLENLHLGLWNHIHICYKSQLQVFIQYLSL